MKIEEVLKKSIDFKLKFELFNFNKNVDSSYDENQYGLTLSKRDIQIVIDFVMEDHEIMFGPDYTIRCKSKDDLFNRENISILNFINQFSSIGDIEESDDIFDGVEV